MPAAKRRRAAYSLVEVLVAVAVLAIGIVGVLQFFPPSLRASGEAALRSRAALLAQQKVEELRRDADKQAILINEIRLASAPTAPIPFPQDTRLAYQFYGKSLRFNGDSYGEVDDDEGVARIIVRYNAAFRPKAEILYELRFDR